MSIFFADDFDSDTLGLTPPGFYGVDISGTVITGGWNGTPQSCGCPAGGIGHLITGVKSISVFYVFRYQPNGDPTGFPIIHASQGDPSDPTGTSTKVMAKVVMEEDRSLTVWGGDIIIGNTGIPIMTNIWYFMQFNVSFDSTTISGQTFLTVQASLTVEGNILVNGGPVVTSILISTLFSGTVACNIVEFKGAGATNSQFDSVLCEDRVAENVYPNPGNPFARVSQAVIEIAEQPTSSFARISQAGIEVVEQPTNANARICQAVIELITKGGVVGGTRWLVSES